MRNIARLGVCTAGIALTASSAFASAPPPPPGCPKAASTFVNPIATPIPTGPAVVTSTIVVAGMNPYLWDVDISALITHTGCADLDITLMSPAGTVITLTTDNGGALDNVFNGTTWDDDANPGGLVPYTANNGVTTDHTYVNLVTATPLVPEENLAIFIGENPNGVWTLTISDDLAANGGSLNGWQLDISALDGPPTVVNNGIFSVAPNIPIPATAPPIVITSQIVVAGLNPDFICDVNVITNIPHTFPGDLDITLTSPAGTIVTLTTDNGSSFDNVFAGTRWDDSANPGGQVPYTANNGLVTDHTYANLVVATPLAPEEAFGAFIGENPNGVWTLTISDDANLDGGTLVDWTLDITVCACIGTPSYRDYLYTGQPTDITAGGVSPIPPIPANFFDPGSEPFDGTVCMEGSPLNAATNTDTITRRLGNPVSLLDPIGTQGSVPIEIVQLSLTSCQPITVTYNNGNPPQQWNVRIGLSNTVPPPGTLHATKTHANGGTFDSQFFVQPKLTFTQVGNPANVRVLDTGGLLPPLPFQIVGAPWVHTTTLTDVQVDPGSEFIPAIVDVPPQHRQLVTASALPAAQHTFCPAFPTGACCLPSGLCVITIEPTCGEMGGVWQGAGSSCTPPVSISYPAPTVCEAAFMDISGTGTPVTYTTFDDEGQNVNLPFAFSFYGNAKTSMLVSTNGYITFGASGAVFTNDAPPTAAVPNDAIYVLWDDQHLRSATEGRVHVQTFGTAPNRVFVVQWTNLDLFTPTQPDGSRNTYQVKLYEKTGVIQMNYANLVPNPPRSATIGVENAAGTAATTVPDVSIGTGNTTLIFRPVGQLCPQPVGACCVGTSCVVLTEAECLAQCGVYHGDGSLCTPTLCSPILTEACCLPNGDCLNVTVEDCEALCGRSQGPGTLCGITTTCIPCPGDVDGDHDVDLTDLARLLSGFGSNAGEAAYTIFADFDCNGTINLTDLATLLSRFGLTCN